jgi:hypothetical protein
MSKQQRYILALAVACGTLLILVYVTFVWAYGQSAKLEGSKPYTPTRLEWFALELNAELRVPLSFKDRYSMDFTPIHTEDAIVIAVFYLPNIDREFLNQVISNAKEMVSLKTEYYGWSSWLKVKERVKMTKIK